MSSQTPEPSSGEPYQPAKPCEVALAATPDTLNDEHPLNVRLRDQGAGMVPRVLQVDVDARSATLGAAAIMCTFDVPLGWHVIDDAKRTLVFDAEGTTQVSLNLRHLSAPGEAGVRDLLERIQAEHVAQQSDLQAHVLDVVGVRVLVFFNLRVGDEVLGQAYWPRDLETGGDSPLALVARITAPTQPGDLMPRALNLAEVIMRSARYMGPRG